MVRKWTPKASENPEKAKKLRFADRCEKNGFSRYLSDRPPSSQTLTIIKTFLRKVTSATKPTEKRCESEVRKWTLRRWGAKVRCCAEWGATQVTNPNTPFGRERPGADLSCLRQYSRPGPREGLFFCLAGVPAIVCRCFAGRCREKSFKKRCRTNEENHAKKLLKWGQNELPNR